MKDKFESSIDEITELKIELKENKSKFKHTLSLIEARSLALVDKLSLARDIVEIVQKELRRIK